MASRGLLDEMEGGHAILPSVFKRTFDSDVPYVGSIVGVPPSLLSSAATVGATLLNGIIQVIAFGPIGGVPAVLGTGLQFAQILNSTNSTPVVFQFFPEEITDSRQNPVNAINLLGQSTPVPTMTGNSDRVISMTLTYACERWAGAGKNLLKWDKYNFDVAKCVQALRSFTYPIGAGVGSFSAGNLPQPFILTLPGTRIGVLSDTIAGVMKSCNVRYVSFFPDGQPRLAHVDVVINEIQQSLTGNITGQDFKPIIYNAYTRVRSGFTMTPVFEGDVTRGLRGKALRNDVSLDPSGGAAHFIPPEADNATLDDFKRK